MRSLSSRVGAMLLMVLAGVVGTGRRADVQGPPGGVEILSVATEKCLDVASGSRDSGASVNQVRCHGGASQRWRAHTATVPGHVYFRNDHSGLCLDVRLGGPADGTLQQYGCHYRDNQLFRFEGSESAPGGARIVVRSSGQCLDVPGGEPRDNLAIQQWPCHGNANQRWVYAEPGTYRQTLAASSIARLDFLLQEGRTYRFELRNFAAGRVPVLRLWSSR